MGRRHARRQLIVAAIAAGAMGCTKGGASSASTAQISSAGGSSTGGAVGASSGGTTQSIVSGSSSATGGGSGTVGTSSGSSTGAPFADGGYVFCSLPNAADGGLNGDGGLARWMCRPGTYFCDLGGEIGNCSQCRSDGDCADQMLPTYDPLRPHCDLDSGIAGYWGFCQQCLRNADCAGNVAGSLCDTNPTFPPNALEPPIEGLGFDNCGRIQGDCRLEGGPDCHVANQLCDPLNGQCEARSTSCTTDQDCAGLLTPPTMSPTGEFVSGSWYLLRPYCVNGTCNSCDGGVCPNNNACTSDADCGNPTNSLAGLRCESFGDGGSQCACTSSSQCSGFWPACTGLDAGAADDAGQPIGVCSCDSDAECGDGGLICFSPFFYSAQAGSSFCGVSCASPEFPSCRALTGSDICDIPSGICGNCVTDEQCVTSLGSGGPFCPVPLTLPFFNCFCILDEDCPAGDDCLGVCIPSFSRCTPETCGGSFCNWDSGACVSPFDAETFPSCVRDGDCFNGVCLEGACVGCRDDADCVRAGEKENTHCCVTPPLDPVCSEYVVHNICVPGCAADADCIGNELGPSCQDGSCGCVTTADCSLGWQCESSGVGGGGVCLPSCGQDGGCPDGFGCSADSLCGPQCLDSSECDGGLGCADNVCQPCKQPSDCVPGSVCLSNGLCQAVCAAGGGCPGGEVCDGFDSAGNGPNLCYECVSAADCPDGEGCNSASQTCGTCHGPTAFGGPSDCPPDAVCSNYWSGPGATGVCLQNCDREPCPDDRPLCAALPSLTPDHQYCFGCLQNADCGDAGSWCDQSFHRTFTCQPEGD